jgi:glycerol uptake facilitator-like aquaporin
MLGGHVNPTVTFGLLVGCCISFGRVAVYWLAQMLGAVVMSFLLMPVSGGTVIHLNLATCPCQILQYYFTFGYK